MALPPERRSFAALCAGEPPGDITALREYAISRGADAFWEYFEPEDGPGEWDVVIFKDAPLPDGRSYIHMLVHLAPGEGLKTMESWPEIREHTFDLLDAAWERGAEEAMTATSAT